MANAKSKGGNARPAPISAHPVFPVIVALWFAALLGFGSFVLRDKKERIGRNPKTGEEVPISPRRVLSFRPSHLMKDRVADGNKG